MFELGRKTFTPRGWPPIEVRELMAGDVIPLFMNGAPHASEIQWVLVSLSVFTTEGERVFASAEDVKKVPARMVPGLTEITREVMALNAPHLAGDTERPT